MNNLVKSKKSIIISASVIICISIFGCQSTTQGQNLPDTRPNIIFVMSDDHAVSSLSSYGSDMMKTPNLDRLAENGVRFTQSFATNAICTPERATLLTGKYSHKNGVLYNQQPFDGSQQTFPKLLQDAGYATAMIGKWHLTTYPTGFDYWKILPGQGDYYNPDFIVMEGDTIREEGYVTNLITDDAIAWIDQKKNEESPFLVMLQTKAPHRTWWPGPDHLGFKHDVYIPEPPTLLDNFEKGNRKVSREVLMDIDGHMWLSDDFKIKPQIAREAGFAEWITSDAVVAGYTYDSNYNRMNKEQQQRWDEVYGPINEQFLNDPPEEGIEMLRWKYQRYMQDYLATVAAIDDNMGRLLDYLDENNLTENTIVVYTSDQGFYLGEHGWYDKRFMYEAVLRTPLMIQYPGQIKTGSVAEEIVIKQDIAPTFLDFAGVDIPEDIQGRSLKQILEGNSPEDWREGMYYHYYEYPGWHLIPRHYGVRTDRYKLIHFYYDVDIWELYDLQEDPYELTNQIDNPEYAEVEDQLRDKLKYLRDKYEDSDELSQEYIERWLEAGNTVERYTY